MNPFALNKIVTGGNGTMGAFVQSTRAAINQHFADTPDYKTNALRNGVAQELIIVATDYSYKKTIIARPGAVFYMGDIIDYVECKWIITDVFPDDSYYLKGEMTLCNLDLHWMDQWGKIHTQWCYLKEPYSDLTKTAQIIATPQKQYTLYLPSNEDTRHMYIDQRLMLDVGTDKGGNDLPYVFRITSIDGVSQFRRFGTILKVHIREVAYDSSDDDKTTMVANSLQDNYEVIITPIGVLSPGDAVPLSYTLLKNGQDIQDVMPTFNVVNEEIAEVDKLGNLHAKKVGTTEVQIYYGTAVGALPIEVSVEAETIMSVLIKGDQKIYLGQTKTYTGTVIDPSGMTDEADVSWELVHITTDDTVASIEVDGNTCYLTVDKHPTNRNKRCQLVCTADGAESASITIIIHAPV